MSTLLICAVALFVGLFVSPSFVQAEKSCRSGAYGPSENVFACVFGDRDFSIFLLLSHNRYEFDVQPRFSVTKVLRLKMPSVGFRYFWDRWTHFFRNIYCVIFLTSYSCICSPTKTNSQNRLIANALKIRRRSIIAITFIAALWATGVLSVIALWLIRTGN